MRFFIAITLFVLASFASAQEWTMNLYYGTGAKQTAYVTSKKFGQVPTGFDPEPGQSKVVFSCGKEKP